MVRFKNELEKCKFQFLEDSELDVNMKFCLWYGKVNEILKSCCKMSRQSVQTETPVKPWISKVLMAAIMKRRWLFKYSNTSPYAEERYRKYNNELNKLLRKAKIEYFREEFKKSEGNPAKTWKTINSVIRPTQSSVATVCTSSPEEAADQMCDHFANIGKNMAGTGSSSSVEESFVQFLPMASDVSAFLRPINVEELRNTVWSMKSNAAGSDYFSLKVLKHVFPVVSEHLVYLFDQCMKCGIFPDCFKSAKVIPLFKGGDKNSFHDYRPISLLPVLSRVFEKMINARMVEFLESRRLLSPTQFGFRRGMSTDQAVLFLVTFVNDALDAGWKAASVFLDIVKAFDSVDHGILLAKLDNCGFRGAFLGLLRSFLHNRSLYVSVGGAVSGTKKIEYGVPQGSVLGPTLFLIFINDLCGAVEGLSFDLNFPVSETIKLIIALFADDAHFTVAAKTELQLMEKLITGMNQIGKWTRANKLRLNNNKSQFLVYGRNPNYYPWINELRFVDTSIQRLKTVKYLGVLIDECLSYKPHIELLSSKIARNVGIMRKLKKFFPYDVIRSLYFSTVHPYLLYCNVVWSSTFPTHLLPLRAMQNSAIRVLCGDKKGASVRRRYVERHILPLHGVSKFYSALFLFKYERGLLPQCFGQMFVAGCNVHEYSTRTASQIRRPQASTRRSFFSIRHVGPGFYNSLPNELLVDENIASFRSRLKSLCFGEYNIS